MRLLSILVPFLIFTTPLYSQQAKVKKSTPPVVEEIDAAVQPFVESGVISGAVTMVSQRGKIVHLSAVGLADIEKQKAMKTSSLFAIASMTKPIVATGLMMLQDEGKLSVDDEVSKYLPEFANVKLKDGTPVERPITIRDCLTHTAGLAGKQTFPELPSLEAGIQQLVGRPLAFQPGSEWKYSPGLNVVGRIIEVVSEQPLDVFLQNRIFDPVKMKQTTFFPDERKIRRIATLYNQKDGKLTPELGFLGKLSEIKAPNPSGGLISSARDMQRFYQMILRRGRIHDEQLVSKQAVKDMTSLQTGDLETGFTPGNGWGLGWCLVQDPQGVSGMLSKGTFGHGGAFGTQGWVDPKTRAIFVLMIQRKGLKNSDDSEVRKEFQTAAVAAIDKITASK